MDELRDYMQQAERSTDLTRQQHELAQRMLEDQLEQDTVG